MVLEQGNGALPKVLLPFRLFTGGPVLPGTQWVSWIHRLDLISLIQWAVTAPTVSGPVNAADPEAVTMKAFSATVGSVLHRPSSLPVPGLAYTWRWWNGNNDDDGSTSRSEGASRGIRFSIETGRPCGRSWRKDEEGEPGMRLLIESVMQYLHALAVAILVGKVVLLSFVVAPVLAKTLERESFGKVVRQLFPAYYLTGMGAAAVGLLSVSGLATIRETSSSLVIAGGIWLVILAAESYCRSPLTPQSNAMRDRLKEQEQQGAVDAGLQAAWNRLHQRSLFLNSVVLFGGLCLLQVARQF
jgi:hypothetical protein